MNTQTAIAIMRQCEKELQLLLQQVSQTGDYELLRNVARWAQGVANLADEAQSVASGTKILEHGVSSIPRSQNRKQPISKQNKIILTAKKKKPKKRKGMDYPKFARRGDLLIKIGWSKKEKKEYQHKAPKYVIEALCEALVQTKDLNVFSTDDIFPLNENDGSEIPNYQSYLCLAWFKAEEIIVQEGRQGYLVPDRKNIHESIQLRWKELLQL